MVVKCEFHHRVLFPEASQRGADPAARCTRRTQCGSALQAALPWHLAGGRTIDKEIALIDVGGVSLSFLRILPAFKAINKIGATFFPARLTMALQYALLLG